MRNWIFLALIIFSFGCKNNLKTLDSIADGINNSYEHAQKIEKYQLNKYSKIAIRKDTALILKLENNQELILKDHNRGTDGVELYSFREYYDPIKVFVVEIQYYEGCSYLLINGLSGEQMNVFGTTKLSPDLKRLVSYNLDITAGYSENGFQIIDLKDNHFSLEYENKPEDWGPENVRWINNSEIEVEKQGFKDGDFRNIGKIYFVKRTNWIEKK